MPDRALIEALGQFAAIYGAFIHLGVFKVHFDYAQARRIWWAGAGALRECFLVVVPCAFSSLVITFRGRRNGNLARWLPESTFRNRRSEWMHTFRDRRSALISWQVQ